MSWVLTLLGIVALIVLHELGHFSVAKLVGMRVERFSLFFPPTLLRVRRGETEYAIGAIPAGGYVKITGMSPEELGGDVDPEVSRRAYYNQSPWKRVAVIVAGPGVNLAIAFALFWVVLFAGNLEGAARIGNLLPNEQTVKLTTAVSHVDAASAGAGVLRKGDRIVAVDGVRASVVSTMRAINAHKCAGALTDGCRAATPVRLTVLRGARRVTLAVYPRYSREVEHVPVKRMLVGFNFSAVAAHYGALGAAGVALHAMWRATADTITGFGRALTETKARREVSSIVGITQRADESVKQGAGQALVFLGFLSLILAVINLFPFLPLDGGHVLWSLAEKVRGRRISLQAMYRFSSVGIILLLFLVINGVSNDISRLAG